MLRTHPFFYPVTYLRETKPVNMCIQWFASPQFYDQQFLSSFTSALQAGVSPKLET